ncbi:hypothetical protein K435DRAFT_962814 [Dendrothele bispora CBS 962.96]|uniref:BZIP domain-containing protein n=1 Tax=Dendrothele bispora (strain CBS 962.96) TaxID=1314807 RepID=A0A4S8MJC7_DENBC|nr:hypothetical protein K435DRAFT_962814 [Dendrothele bispora CBS 962.96]
MSSKRGRKRNDNLPPNRARDVQRAFRARRAAHLQALEQRVAELEEENNCLRQALSLPLANRPPLGKGPTGKDKPKAFDPVPPPPLSLRSRDSSSADSPGSTRVSSNSPSQVALGPTRVDDASPWEQTILIHDQHQQQPDHPSSSASNSYPLPPMSAPAVSSKSIQYNPYPNTLTSSSASSSRSPMYIGNSQTNYSHSADRPMPSSYGSPSFTTVRNPVREDQRGGGGGHYSYSPSPYQPHDDSPLPAPVSAPIHHSNRDSSVPYSTRRSLTEPQPSYPGTMHSGFPNLQLPSPQNIRLPSPPQGLQDSRGGSGSHLSSARQSYGPDGRSISGMS